VQELKAAVELTDAHPGQALNYREEIGRLLNVRVKNNH
jgi:hypothetical protein